ncbi:uncharacterized protein LOC128366852 [Scomber japonicus]|uniref:uncharacterized protein LOC128366852 n=1 Tax=Scomber japonicus TaxID=13676 RepID=UPI002306970B|nr:uncharacterized protein LOC128366852 [Scomber japonicus]
MEAQMRIIFFFIVMISAATEEIYLSATEGGNITLPEPLLEDGYIIFKGKNVAVVNNGSIRLRDLTYTNRLHWDKNTGLFTITGLKMSDSGSYTIDPNEGNIFPAPYILTVYERVPSPAVNTVNVSTESCILLCSVDKAETTLLWYKDEEILNQSSSALSLPLTVHKQDFRSSYRCVAANPAENKTLHVNIKTSCWNITDDTDKTDETERNYLVPLIICTVSAVALVSLVVIAKKKYHKKSETITSQAQEVLLCMLSVLPEGHYSSEGVDGSDVAMLSGSNIREKEYKFEKYQGLKEELENMWGLKVTVVPVVIRTLGVVTHKLQE